MIVVGSLILIMQESPNRTPTQRSNKYALSGLKSIQANGQPIFTILDAAPKAQFSGLGFEVVVVSRILGFWAQSPVVLHIPQKFW